MSNQTGRGLGPSDPLHHPRKSRLYDDVEQDDRRYRPPAEQPASRVVDIDPLDAGPAIPRPAGRSGLAPRATEPSSRLGIPDADEIQHIGGRRRLRPEIALLVVGAIFLIGALAKPWPSEPPAASAIAAASPSSSPASEPSTSAAAGPTGAIAAVPSAVAYPDIPPYNYRWPFFGSAPSAAASGRPAAPTVAPIPTWSAVDWSILTASDTHSGWGFAAAVMPGTGPNPDAPRTSWFDAGTPPVFATVPLVQGRNVYGLAVTWPSTVHVTAVRFVYLGPPQSPSYLPPAGFLPNVQVTPLPALRVASPSAGPAARPTIPPWVDPAAGEIRSGQFWIPPSEALRNAISSKLTMAWQSSPWPWPYGTYQVTVTSDTGATNIILDLLLSR